MSSIDRSGRYTIGEVSEILDLTPRSIRFYEDQGLICPKRQKGRRIYNYKDIARLMLVARGKRLGFSIAKIKTFLDFYDGRGKERPQMEFLLGQAEDQIAHLEQQLVDVQQTLKELTELKSEIEDFLKLSE